MISTSTDSDSPPSPELSSIRKPKVPMPSSKKSSHFTSMSLQTLLLKPMKSSPDLWLNNSWAHLVSSLVDTSSRASLSTLIKPCFLTSTSMESIWPFMSGLKTNPLTSQSITCSITTIKEAPFWECHSWPIPTLISWNSSTEKLFPTSRHQNDLFVKPNLLYFFIFPAFVPWIFIESIDHFKIRWKE